MRDKGDFGAVVRRPHTRAVPNQSVKAFLLSALDNVVLELGELEKGSAQN